jgi:hypothetical protein
VTLPRVAEDIRDYAITVVRFQKLWTEQRAYRATAYGRLASKRKLQRPEDDTSEDVFAATGHGLAVQSIWNLLTWRNLALCADLRDRIYSVLPVAGVNDIFSADYTEPPIDLFWRVGEHFGAWAQPKLITHASFGAQQHRRNF